eukprot:10368-Eustigmatos_ZCMA.PRE.1
MEKRRTEEGANDSANDIVLDETYKPGTLEAYFESNFPEWRDATPKSKRERKGWISPKAKVK